MITNNTHTKRFRGLRQALTCWLCCMLAFGAQAQYGVNDPTFNPNDRGDYFGDGHTQNTQNTQTILLPGGKLYILGSSTGYNGVYAGGVQRINSDGSLDTSFHTTGTDRSVTSGAVMANGQLVITGFFTQYNGTPANHIARINVDGSIDTSFHTGTGLNLANGGYNPGLALQADGKVIVGDLRIYDYNGTTIPNLCRINTDGSIDSTYLLNLPANPTTAWGMTVLANGKLMLAGVQRLNTDGTADSTFDRGGVVNGAAYAVVEQPDHKLLLGGTFQDWNGVNVPSILRVDTLGNLDTTFNLGHSNISYCRGLSLEPNGKIMAGGFFDTINGRLVNGIVRLNADGTTDATFNAGSAIADINPLQLSVNSISILSNGQMIIAGGWYTFNGLPSRSMLKLNANGSIDGTFNRMGSADNEVNAALIQRDGKLVFGGAFDVYQGVAANNIVRTDANGQIDTTFNTHGAINLGNGNTGVLALAQQRDGKIVAGGSFYDFNSQGQARIGRFNTDGSPDTTFHAGTGADGDIYSIALDTTGRMVIGGYFTHVNGTALNYLARLTADGSLDTTFHIGTGANGQVKTVIIQPNGKILVSGYFSTYNGINTYGLMRLNTDGSVDTSFTIGYTIYPASMELLPNGQIMAGGNFSYYDPRTGGGTFNNMVRFNSNGTPDRSFYPYSTINGQVNSIHVLADGKYFITGGFTRPGNSAAVIYPNGTAEHIFSAGSGTDQDLRGAILQGNNIIIYGVFGIYDHIGRNRLARLINFCTMPASPHGAVGATICSGDSATISIAAGTGTLGWYSDSLSSSTHISGGTSYSTGILTQTTTFYVQDSTCDQSFIRTPVTVVVKNKPRVNLSSNLDTVCAGSPETLYVRSDSGATFHWATGATADSIIVHPAASGYYAVSVTSVNHCLNADSIFVLTYPGAPQVHVLQLPSGVNAATGGTASASDSYGGNPPADAFNGDTTLTGWGNSGNGLPSWLAYDFGAGHSKVIKAYSFYNSKQMQGGWNCECYNPVSWTFEGSNDSITWTKLDTIADGHMRQGNISYYVSANNTAYRRYRFNFDYTTDNGYVRLNEVQMFAIDTQFCRDANFIVTADNFSSISGYQWKVRGVNTGTNSTSLTLPKVHYGDSVSCTVTGSTYCSYPGSATGSTIIRSAPNNTTVVNGATITSNALGAQYQWVRCDGATQTKIPGKTSASFTPDSSGTYAVIVIEGSCVDTSVCVSFTKPSGIDAIGADGISLSIYPNPNNGTFMIRSSVSGEFSLTDALGQKIQNISLHADVPYQLSNETISSGIYYVTANDQTHLIRNKIVVVKQ